MQRHNNGSPEIKEFTEKVVQVSRVSKKTKGGNQATFSVLVVVGDRKGRVGVALGKAPDVLSSIKKGIRKAKKRLINVPLKGTTVPFSVQTKYGAAKVMLKPAPQGSGIIAGGAVRAVVEAAGITDIVGKILGSSNKASNVYATFQALDDIRKLAKIKGIKLTTQAELDRLKKKRSTKTEKQEEVKKNVASKVAKKKSTIKTAASKQNK